MKFVTMGIMYNGFYFVEGDPWNDEIFTFYYIDVAPPEILNEETLSKFLWEHETDGYSVTGEWNDVMKEMVRIIDVQCEVIEMNI